MRVPRKAIAAARAADIHRELRIQEPDEIQVEKIANYYEVMVVEEPLKGMDGCIVKEGDRAIVSIRGTYRKFCVRAGFWVGLVFSDSAS